MPKRLANTKRVNLEDVVAGWGDDCYALVVPASYPDTIELNDMASKKDNVALILWQIDFVKKHLVSGKVMVMNDDETVELGDLVPEYVDIDRNLGDVLFNEIMGVAADPKDSPTPTPTAPATGNLPTTSSSTEPSDTTNNTKTQ